MKLWATHSDNIQTGLIIYKTELSWMTDWWVVDCVASVSSSSRIFNSTTQLSIFFHLSFSLSFSERTWSDTPNSWNMKDCSTSEIIWCLFALPREQLRRSKGVAPGNQERIWMCQTRSHFSVASRTWHIYHLFIICYYYLLSKVPWKGVGRRRHVLYDLTPHGSVLGTNWILTVLLPMVAGCPCLVRYFS